MAARRAPGVGPSGATTIGALIGLGLGFSVPAQQLAEESAFVELVTARDTYFLQEPIPVVVRFGFAVGFVERNLVPLFRQRLDVSAQVQAPWLRELAGAVALDEARPKTDGQRSFALNDSVAMAVSVGEIVRGGRRFDALEIKRTLLPNRVGVLRLPAPALRFAYATQFREDLLNSRVALNRLDHVVHGEPRAVRIQALPEQGRPTAFTGAVGRFEISAEAQPRVLEVGQRLEVTLRIQGEGNTEYFDAPSLANLAGLHVQGQIDDKSRRMRTIVYHLTPTGAGLAELPPLRFSFFDPGDGGASAAYRTVQTLPIQLEVRPAAGRSITAAGEPRAAGDDDIFDLKPTAERSPPREPRRWSAPLSLIALLLPWGVALGLRSWARLRSRRPRETTVRRVGLAATEFRSQVDRPDCDLTDELTRFLAACLQTSPAAVIAPDLADRLIAVGVSEDLAARAADTLETLVAHRYGGQITAQSEEAVRAIVVELEVGLGRHGSSPRPGRSPLWYDPR